MINNHFPPPPPPPPPPPHFINDRGRAKMELESAYRELNMGELIVHEIENTSPNSEEATLGREILLLANKIYQQANAAYDSEAFFRAAEFSVCVKDLMRAIDKLKHTYTEAKQK